MSCSANSSRFEEDNYQSFRMGTIKTLSIGFMLLLTPTPADTWARPSPKYIHPPTTPTQKPTFPTKRPTLRPTPPTHWWDAPSRPHSYVYTSIPTPAPEKDGSVRIISEDPR